MDTGKIHPDDFAVPAFDESTRPHWADDDTKQIEREIAQGPAKGITEYDPLSQEW